MNKFTLLIVVLFVFSFAVLALFQMRLTSTLLTIDGVEQQHTIDVYVAKTPKQLYRGLGKRKQLDKDGMLFVFGQTKKHGIVMREMQFPIDIVWIDHGVVVDIAPFVHPEPGVSFSDLRRYFPRKEANLVLELPAGGVETYGIRIGTEITHNK